MAQRQDRLHQRKANLLKGLAAGVIAGAAAAVVMNQFQKLCSRLLIGEERSHGAQSLQKGAPHRGAGKMLERGGAEDPNDDSAERLAQTVSVGIFDHKLTEQEKDKAGTAFHYGFGISMGAVYGAAAEIIPEATFCEGLPYGALIWMGADELVVPALGLSKAGDEYPASIHAAALGAHLVYGLTLESVRNLIRNIL